ncbi:MAG TPA: hypothetical protein VHX15_21335 [Frankiaceae bacterium]|jgi:hypothetical protein|nr:hypothetical protein [Frankiaceae bacterium]
MTRVQLGELCGARSGDKLDISDVTLFAPDQPTYKTLCDRVTAAVVAEHFAGIASGPVERYLVPNVWALKFVLHGALGGGASTCLRSDSQGKTHGLALLRLWVDVPDHLVGVASRLRPRHPDAAPRKAHHAS